MPLDDAIGAASMLVETGRAVAPQRWVDFLADAAESASLESLI